jgi:serine/threonine protein phosphatase 1
VAIPPWKVLNAGSADELAPEYTEFLRQTKYFIQTDDFIAVHAGLNFSAADPLKDKDSMLWIRDYQVDRLYLDGRLLIHGHTPERRDFIRSQKFESPFNIDGGCVYKHTKGMGSLFALNFYEQKLLEVPNID